MGVSCRNISDTDTLAGANLKKYDVSGRIDFVPSTTTTKQLVLLPLEQTLIFSRDHRNHLMVSTRDTNIVVIHLMMRMCGISIHWENLTSVSFSQVSDYVVIFSKPSSRLYPRPSTNNIKIKNKKKKFIPSHNFLTMVIYYSILVQLKLQNLELQTRDDV